MNSAEDEITPETSDEFAFDPDLDTSITVHPAIAGKFIPISLPPPSHQNSCFAPVQYPYDMICDMANQSDWCVPMRDFSWPQTQHTENYNQNSKHFQLDSQADLICDIQGLLATAEDAAKTFVIPAEKEDHETALKNVATFISSMTGIQPKMMEEEVETLHSVEIKDEQNGHRTDDISRASTSCSSREELTESRNTEDEISNVSHPCVKTEEVQTEQASQDFIFDYYSYPMSDSSENFMSRFSWDIQQQNLPLQYDGHGPIQFMMPETNLSDAWVNGPQSNLGFNQPMPFVGMPYSSWGCSFPHPYPLEQGQSIADCLQQPVGSGEGNLSHCVQQFEPVYPKKSYLQHDKYFPDSAKEVLRSWLFNHIAYPYPNKNDKDELCMRTGLTLKQINNWFTNTRKRHWRKHRYTPSTMIQYSDVQGPSFHTHTGPIQSSCPSVITSPRVVETPSPPTKRAKM
eukprot:GHVP01010237.1.p1 GENE.GHVP01010237.1~~GHVP01010237.1.p1  ORF type:complete len:458 (+),score=72.69 GHVP01010237.1:104-1477(+)